MIETIATVVTNDEYAPGYKRITLGFDLPINTRPGQFAMLKPLGRFEPLLRRALAVYVAPQFDWLSFLYQILGRGTQALAECRPGSKVEVLAPLGNSWPLPPRPDEDPKSQVPRSGIGLKATAKRAIVVSGGIGSASLYTLCAELAYLGTETQLFFGAASRTAAIGCGLDDFDRMALTLSVTTDDGSLGERGFVTAPLERYLREGGGKDATIYACGPWMMLRRVAEIAARSELPCLASLEAPMGCGFGVCVGCVVAMKTESDLGYDSYKRVCIDGSIFPADSIRWDVNAMAH